MSPFECTIRSLNPSARVLELGLGDGGTVALQFRALGHDVSVLPALGSAWAAAAEKHWGIPAKDLRLASLGSETWDVIWCDRVLPLYPPEGVERILAAAFRALKPKTGRAFWSVSADEEGFRALLRKNGYQLEEAFQQMNAGTPWYGFFCSRI